VDDQGEPLGVTVARTSELPDGLLAALRRLLVGSFGPTFCDDDWQHALGGWHAVVLRDRRPVSHAAVVTRELHVGEVAVDAGYLEGVATDPAWRGRGLGTLVLRAAHAILRREFDMGALSTGAHGFYERLGWERWHGPTYVRRPDGTVRTPDEDDGIMVLRFGSSAQLDLSLPLSCAARAGDDW
jgi:aminoglycoside 2'-N-acetyltransferase I